MTNLTSLTLTRQLLSFNTTNPPGQERDCAKYLAKVLEDIGFQTCCYEFARDRTTVVAHLNGEKEQLPICFTGHIDTVPLGATTWEKDPFAGETEANKLYGRGSSDMKAGIAAMVIAASRFAQQPGRKAGMKLILTAGEETCCEGAYHLAGLGNVLGEAGTVIVGEPSTNYPWIGHKGAVRFAIRTKGITAHASMPELGDNAIYKAAQVILKLQSFEFGIEPHPFLGKPTLNVGTITGGQNINSVPDETTIGVDIRTIPGQDHQAIQQQLQMLLGEEVEITCLNQAQSVATEPSHDWIQTIFEITKPYLDTAPVAKGASYFTDASVFTPAFGHPPTVILGPGEPTMAHKTNEFCYVSKIEEAAEIYTHIAERWCS
ncbi:M20 family metallopeptidase [Leptolyngbya sp. FACHB-541]|uniref:M20 family metallopeptidase n=1 Tax=Leptolyngbya sp. FACHB-541 TaxID=2692810 RepID=UPI00168334AF|nr:M20 family metallopeptidase [Leptolyngbya sp. FACHB-541]MBD1998854.1 M20 family metallopeptidase [Leptolyngbya sp. FACHB-541]